MDLNIGRTGLIIVLVVFLLLAIEDILIWLNSGVLPGIEFLIAALLLAGLFLMGINQVRNQRYPRP